MGTINEKLNYLLQTKENIKQAIKGKGVEITDSDSFRSYAEKIGIIKAGGDEPKVLIDYPSTYNLPAASATLIISNTTDIRIVDAMAEIKEN